MTDRPDYREALARVGLLDLLAAFDPHVAGTPPLGIDVAGSDIDVLCHAPDPAAFAAHLWEFLRHEHDFTLWQWSGEARPVLAGFTAHGWDFEIFGHVLPVSEQAGYRHFRIEERLLALGGEPFRAAIMALRLAGAKTEPAFATLLGLPGNPYAALLDLEAEDDARLAVRIGQALDMAYRGS